MSVCLFLTSYASPEYTPTTRDLHHWLNKLGSVPGLVEARAHRPAEASDPMLDNNDGPALVIQLFFETVEQLEQAQHATGLLANSLRDPLLAPLFTTRSDQQAMLVRRYKASTSHHDCCTYLVRYAGPAADTAAWLTNYLSGHPPLMLQLPGLLALEIFTRIDWCPALPIRVVNDLQRNQVVFKSPDALSAALNSPLRAQMRAHYDALPPFEGPVTHTPMHTVTTDH